MIAFLKRKWFFILLFALVVLVIALYIFYKKKSGEVTVSPTTPSPEMASGQDLVLVDRVPKTEIYKSIWSTDPLVLTFNDVVNPRLVKYDVSPKINSRLIETVNSKAISILPMEGWQENQEYTITIFNGLVSVGGKKLEKDVVVKVKRVLPNPGDPEYPDEIEENY